MKKVLVLSFVMAAFVAVLTTSCSMQSMTFKNLEKKGYVVGELTPEQQVQIAPLMQAFPTLNLTAEAYVASDYSISYLYEASEADWLKYAATLTSAGFSKVGSGYVKADRASGITYNVSYKMLTLSKKDYLVVTFTSTTL